MHRLLLSSRCIPLRPIRIQSSPSTMKVQNQYPAAAAVIMAVMTSSAYGFQQPHPSIVPTSRRLSSFSKQWNGKNHRQSSQNKLSWSDADDTDSGSFKTGDSIQVEVSNFGPMGASVDVVSIKALPLKYSSYIRQCILIIYYSITFRLFFFSFSPSRHLPSFYSQVGLGHDPQSLIDVGEPPLGQGLILQKEISYFRQARNNLDVVRGEVLPAYVEKIREDGKLNIALRQVGGRAKAESVGKLILEELQQSQRGTLVVGDKSRPEDIAQVFPGVSKGAFKKAVSALYKQGVVKPGPYSIELISK